MKQKLYRMLAILLVVMVCGGGALQAQNPVEDPGKARKLSVGPDGQSEEAVIRKAVLATVRIITGNRNPTTNEFYGTSSGSGVFIGSTGLILTARHVVFQQEGKGEVFPEIWCGVMSADSPYTPPNRGFRLQLVKDDRQLDLALLRIPAPVNGTFPQLNLGTGSELFYGSLLRVAGFPEAGGATTTVVPTTVLGIDDQLGEIKVDGALMRGASGGPAFNAKGELIGIVLGVKKDTVPFFADEGLSPVGNLTLGTVGYLRSARAIHAFLSGTVTSPDLTNPPTAWSSQFLPGVVLDEATLKPIPGVVVVVLSPFSQLGSTATQDGLMAYAKSDFNGKFTFNRYLPPGRYRIKIVHPQYKTFDSYIEVQADYKSVAIKLVRES